MPFFTVTYEIVTPESAEIGDAEERGFVAPGGWHDSAPARMTLRDAMQLACPSYDCGSWFVDEDASMDYRTGAAETRSIHPPRNITPASYARVRRILGLS